MPYIQMPEDEVQENLRFFKQRIDSFMKTIFPENVDYFVSGIDLIDMIIRVHKRKDYYRHFHGMNINELKTAAVAAYWILKLRPIQMRDARFINKTEACNINEKFALYLIFHVLISTGKINPSLSGKEPFIVKLLYSFRFRNFTIDSMVVLVESMCNETFTQNSDTR